MASDSLKQMCELVSDVAYRNATHLCDRFIILARSRHPGLEPEFILKTFAFMNWTFAQGVWSHLKIDRLRRDLQIELKEALILRLAKGFSTSDCVEKMAAKAVFLTEEFNAFLLSYKARMEQMDYADAGTARLFALEFIQERFEIDDRVMNAVVFSLWDNNVVNSEVESVAMQVNRVFEGAKKRGLFDWLLGKSRR